jgi:putative iron-dependent peroxidase
MGRTATPQAVLAPLTEAAIFLVATIGAGNDAEQATLELLSDVSALTRSVGFRIPNGGLSCVTGIGAGLWDRLFGTPRPAGLHPFREVTGPRHAAVSTPGDILFHIRARQADLCFELAAQLTNRLREHARMVDEVHGFRYFDQRDLLGFVDGTENPAGAAAVAAVTIGDEDHRFAGGSYAIVQKYLHDLEKWNALATEEQELVVGRTKLSDIELGDEVKPSNSHVALNTITGEDGKQRQILRANMAFGSVGDAQFGTYFIGYSSTPEVTELMLSNMFVGNPPGNYDRILDFSKAVTGCLFFVPSADFLEDPEGPTASPKAGAWHGDSSPSDDGSLHIGSLR